MARASGCSLALSAAAASASSSSAVVAGVAASIATTRGRPSVRVPVLSTSRVVAWASRSSASASFTSTPAWAPRPMPVTSETGVARPSAQGQAMMSTATALTSA